MKKLSFVALFLAAISAGAEQLEDVTILINVRSSEPVTMVGALPVPTAPAPAVPVTPAAPTVVYSTPVVYNGPVYNAPVVYNPPPVAVPVPSCAPAYCWDDYACYPSYPCSFVYNPDLILFGEIQAAREGYFFSHRR